MYIDYYIDTAFRLDLCLFCESYLEHIAEQSTTKVKKNGLTYLYSMAKNLIRAQYLMYRECKRGMDELFEWKMEMMRAHDRITQSFVPLVQHFGFDHVIGLLFNFLLLSLFQTSDTESSGKLSAVKVVSFDEVVTVNEQQGRTSVLRKPHWQSMPVAMTTLDTMFNYNVRTIAAEKDQIARYLALIRLLMERALKFVHEHRDKKMGKTLYALYTRNMTTPFAVPSSTVSIVPLLRKSMGLSRYFPPSSLDVVASLKSKKATDNKLSEEHQSVIQKNLGKLAHYDLTMEILMMFTLFSCMSPHQFIDDLLQFPTTSRMMDMIILREWEWDNKVPPAQRPLDIQYETDQEVMQRFCLHFIAAENTKSTAAADASKSTAPSASNSVQTSPMKTGGRRLPGYLRKAMVPNLTILVLEDRLWTVPTSIISKLKHFEAQFDISRHLWKRYLNSQILADILMKYDYDQIVPSFLHHASRDLSLIQTLQLNDPLLIVHAVFHIVEHQRMDHWRCLMEMIKRLRVLFQGIMANTADSGDSKAVQLRVIQCVLQHILSFHEKVVRNGRHSASDLLDTPHLVLSAILQKPVPYIDYDAMRIHLSSNMREFVNPCKWLFEVHAAYPMDTSNCLVESLDCISRLLTLQKYTHFHLTAYIHFCATCITTMGNQSVADTANNTKNARTAMSQTLYKLVIILCDSLLSYPLAFGELLQKNNVDADVQKLVHFAMTQAPILVDGLLTTTDGGDDKGMDNMLTIHQSTYPLLTLKGPNKVSFKCPVNVVIAMLYIIGYCKEPQNGVVSWLSFIVSTQLAMQIVMDTATLKLLQQRLPEQLRWKLLLKFDNLQLYCFMFRISTMESLCSILPFLVDHNFEPLSLDKDGGSNSSGRPTAAVQMISWICNEMVKANGRFGDKQCKTMFDRILKPMIVCKANEGITIWKKIRMQCPKLFESEDDTQSVNQKESALTLELNDCPMLMALFGDLSDKKDVSSRHAVGSGDVEMTDSQLMDHVKDMDLVTHLVGTFEGDMNMECWSRLIGALFAMDTDMKRAEAVNKVFEELVLDTARSEDVRYAQCVRNLTVNYRDYLDRLLAYCTEEKQVSIRKNIKAMMVRDDLTFPANSELKIDDEVEDNPLCDWLTELHALSQSEDNNQSAVPRKRNWSQVKRHYGHDLDVDEEQKKKRTGYLDVLPLIGGFGCDLMMNVMHNAPDHSLRFQMLSRLISSGNGRGDKTLPVALWMKSVETFDDLQNLFSFSRVPDEQAMELILKEMESVNDSKIEEPPKKKARKFKLTLKRSGKCPVGSPSTKMRSFVAAEKVSNEKLQRVYAEFVSTKLMDNPSLFHTVCGLMDNSKGLEFIEQCIESMCHQFHSPIRGEFAVKQMLCLLDQYPTVLKNVIHVLGQHVEAMVKKQDTGSLAKYLLTNREDWYFHHFAMLLCAANVEKAYALENGEIERLIESIIVFLKHCPMQFTHLNNDSVHLTSLLLVKLSKHFFHLFPDEMSDLEQKFESTKTAKMWNVMQCIDRLNI